MPRAVNPWKIGPHVSSAGGIENSIINAAAVGANAFAIFLKSQRKWQSNPLKEESIAKFKTRMKAFGYSPSHILPHGSYLVNLGNPDKEKRDKSYECFLDDLKRCEELGLLLYNFHPGSTVGVATLEESQALIAECINRAHKETERVVVVLENMAGAGNVIGGQFSDLGGIIKHVEERTRVGVCLDTCMRTCRRSLILTQPLLQATLDDFDSEVGLSFLRGMHINDSKGALGSKRDRHENIGLGHLGLQTFAHVLSDPRTRDIPLILETPAYDVPASSGAARDRLAKEGMGVWRTEVSVLNRLSGRLGHVDGADTAAGEGEIKDSEFDAWKEEIRDAVRVASPLKDAKGKKEKGKDEKGKQKGKRNRGEEDQEDEDDGVDCEDH
ncbi:AP endonuclease [Dichomitus squalens]|uniref:Apurinic-apyrimidinic endonuclease 1 n=1 Tax=Dichomitus squalens TaxID=114155 RepID=A0A4Q9PVQ4_9APHY|nr:AP endonuclease [Dichomitus squalens]